MAPQAPEPSPTFSTRSRNRTAGVSGTCAVGEGRDRADSSPTLPTRPCPQERPPQRQDGRSGWCRQGRYIQSDAGRAPPVPGGTSRGGGARSSPEPSRALTLWPQGAAERQEPSAPHLAALRSPRQRARASAATMNHSPLKTALAYECFQDQDNSTLALPSDQKMKTGTSGRQRVQEQVLMTVKRQKSKSSQSSTLSHSNRGKGCAHARARAGSARGPCAPAPPRGAHIRRCGERGSAGEAGLRGANPERPAPSRPRRRAPVSAQVALQGPNRGGRGAGSGDSPLAGRGHQGRRAPWGRRPLSRGLSPAGALSFRGNKCVGREEDFPLAPGWALKGALGQSACCSPGQPHPRFPTEVGC